MAGWIHFYLLRILSMDGNINEAENVISHLEELSHQSYMPWFVAGLVQAW